MKKNIKNNLDYREAVIISIVISFLTAVFVCIIVGVLSYNLFSDIREIKFVKEQKIEKVNSGEDPYLSAATYEEAVINVVEKASPAVVSIIVTKDLPVMEEYYQEYNPFNGNGFFDQFFGNGFLDPFSYQVPQYRQKGTEEKEIGGGTGFIISSDSLEGVNGSLILTNKHVVSDEEADYTVLTNDGEKISAEVVARDPVQDIAILRIDKTGLSTIKLGDSDNIKIGQTAIVIGNALGEFRNTVSVGVISGLKRSITASSGNGESELLSEVIQTDAAVNQGNSGGPLLNLRGEAIAISVAMAQGAENVGFALPINKAKRDVEQVLKEGKITYPFLGIRYILITSEIQKKNNLEVDYGALIVRGDQPGDLAIIPGGPADKSDLQENDIVLEIEGERISLENPLSDMIQKYNVGDKIKLKILHKGEEKIIEVELGERK
ncbi:S1C family serine protease [Patescibacteria group bacterium]